MITSIHSDLIRGNVNTIILKALFEGDRYGYEICKEIEFRSSGQYILKQPTLYSCLKRLEDQEYISAYWGTKTLGGRRKYYSLTPKGRDIFVKNQTEWEYTRTVIDRLVSDREFDLNALPPMDGERRNRGTAVKKSAASYSSVIVDEDTSETHTHTVINTVDEEIINRTLINELAENTTTVYTETNDILSEYDRKQASGANFSEASEDAERAFEDYGNDGSNVDTKTDVLYAEGYDGVNTEYAEEPETITERPASEQPQRAAEPPSSAAPAAIEKPAAAVPAETEQPAAAEYDPNAADYFSRIRQRFQAVNDNSYASLILNQTAPEQRAPAAPVYSLEDFGSEVDAVEEESEYNAVNDTQANPAKEAYEEAAATLSSANRGIFEQTTVINRSYTEINDSETVVNSARTSRTEEVAAVDIEKLRREHVAAAEILYRRSEEAAAEKAAQEAAAPAEEVKGLNIRRNTSIYDETPVEALPNDYKPAADNTVNEFFAPQAAESQPAFAAQPPQQPLQQQQPQQAQQQPEPAYYQTAQPAEPVLQARYAYEGQGSPSVSDDFADKEYKKILGRLIRNDQPPQTVAATAQQPALTSPEYVIKPHDKRSLSDYNSKYYIYSNKLRFVQYTITAAIMLVEVLITFLIVNLVLQNGSDAGALYIAGISAAIALVIIAGGLFLAAPAYKKRVDFSPGTTLVYKFFAFLLCSILTVAINIWIDKNIFMTAEHLIRIVLPIILLTNFLLSSIIFGYLYKSKIFAAQ
ncbi:MAG: helix-turn-helix transcriptional regulator [Clostridiales bacterium]|jgi:PadR family transcriptional regulator PadR|nr:helix-turn-helix transcriptional regulator [Clostridiales bacterium]